MKSDKSYTAKATEEKHAIIKAAIAREPKKSNMVLARELGFGRGLVGRVREGLRNGEPLIDRRRIIMPDGAILSQLCTSGLEIEAKGVSPRDVAKQLGISNDAYIAGRDVVQLAFNTALGASDKARAVAALEKMDETRRPSMARAEVKDLLDKMWGTIKAPHNAKRKARVIEDYMHAVIAFTEGAERVREMKVPLLGIDDRTRARADLKRSKSAIESALKRLNGGV